MLKVVWNNFIIFFLLKRAFSKQKQRLDNFNLLATLNIKEKGELSSGVSKNTKPESNIWR